MDALATVLNCFDVDLYMEYKNGEPRYTGRLWEDGGMVAECEAADLPTLFALLDKNAAAIANYC